MVSRQFKVSGPKLHWLGLISGPACLVAALLAHDKLKHNK